MKVLQFTVPGRPVSVNGTYERRDMNRGGRGLRLSAEARDYWERIQGAAVNALGHVRCPFRDRIVLIAQAWFTRDADAGAVSKLVQDALQGIAYPNDARVACAINWKGGNDRINPRTDVTVRELTDYEMSCRRLEIEIPIMSGPEEIRRDLASILRPAERERINRGRLRPAVRRYGQDHQE